MKFELLYLNKIRHTMPVFSHLIFKWFGFETEAYKCWWRLYSAAIDSALKAQKK